MALSTAEIMSKGMKCLMEQLGVVDAERFVATVIREKFDYTRWQREYFDGKAPEEISLEAEAFKREILTQEPPCSFDPESDPEPEKSSGDNGAKRVGKQFALGKKAPKSTGNVPTAPWVTAHNPEVAGSSPVSATM